MKKEITIVLLCFFYLALKAQLPQNAMGKPIYLNGFLTEKLLLEKIGKKDFQNTIQSFWTVFSDRENNITCYAPDGKNKGNINFMERVTIAELNGEWAHIYKEKYQQRWPNISSSAQDLGWIQLNNLIINDYVLTNDYMFTQKGMVLTSVNAIDHSNINTINQFYNDPNLNKQNKNYSKTFEIYYILKKDRNAYLLCKADRLRGSEEEAKGNVLGWMNKNNITSWDYRVCLEPNWEIDAKAEYNNTTIGIFLDKQKAERFENSGNTNGSIRNINLKGKREDGYLMRSPILETDGALKKVGTIGSITALDESEEAKIRKKLQDVNDKLANINILFVIDGTISMKPFYSPVAEAIAKSISRIKNNDSKNKIRFGAAIYRDYADKGKLFELKKLTTNYNEVVDYITNVSCESQDNDLPEAVYNGLIEGIDNAGFIEKQSNFLILVGDAGNHIPDRNGKSIEQVVKLMTKYQCSMVGFQVNNGYDITYDYFIQHARDMLYETACNLAKNALNSNSNNRISCSQIKWDMINKNTFKLNIVDKKDEVAELLMVGRFIFSSKNNSMNTQELESAVENTIEEYDKRVNQLKALLENSVNRIGGQFTAEFETWMINQGFTEKEISKLKSSGQIKVEGWTSDKTEGKRNPCFKPVIFLSEYEFKTLLLRLDQIDVSSLSGFEQRKRLQSALIGICKAAIVGGMDEGSENTVILKSLNEVWNILIGTDFYDNTIGNFKLKDITDQSVFNESDFNNFFERFKNRKEVLNRYRDTGYPIFFQSNDTKFYWIPMEELP